MEQFYDKKVLQYSAFPLFDKNHHPVFKTVVSCLPSTVIFTTFKKV
jgi:hypothetical protein